MENIKITMKDKMINSVEDAKIKMNNIVKDTKKI